MRVLLVDADVARRERHRDVLRSGGVAAVGASGLGEAWVQLSDARSAVVVVDATVLREAGRAELSGTTRADAVLRFMITGDRKSVV